MENKTAACVLLVNDDDKVLGVCRRGTTDQWGLPGGAREPGETYVDCAVRELEEETRVVTTSYSMEKLIHMPDREVETITYWCHKWYAPKELKGDAGPVQWISWQDLLNGPFGEYNAKVKEEWTWVCRGY